MDTRTAAPDPEMPRGEADGADGSELPGDDNREFKTFKGQGFDPGHVVGPKKAAELRAGLIRAAQALPKGAERTALLAVVNGEDPGGEIQTRRAAELTLREDVIRLAHSMPQGSDERRKLMGALVEAKGKVPEEFKEYQGKKNPKKPGSDADGDGETGEPSPVPEKDEKKAALVRLAATLPTGSDERKAILVLADGCDKLPEGLMRDNCKSGPPGAKKKDDKKDDKKDEKGKKDDKKDDGKMPADLLEKFKKKKAEDKDEKEKHDEGAIKDDEDHIESLEEDKDEDEKALKKEKKKAKVKEDSECMKKYQDADGSFKGGKGAAFKNCVKGFEECATGVTDAAGLCATIGREHGKMASASVKDAGTAAFKAARAMGESPEVALLAARVAMTIRRG